MAGVFIDPVQLQKALAPAGPVATAHFEPKLGPSAPHVDHEEDPGMPTLGFPSWRDWLPGGMPKHYTQVLDDLWPEYDDPEERTAERLQALLDEVSDEALRVHLLSVEVFEKAPASWKLSAADRDRFHKEFIAYTRRLSGYRDTLASLDPKSTSTDAVYFGLVQTREGAGPVPDAIMHMYFATQLGILDDHVDEMGSGFVGRTLTSLDKINQAVIEKGETIIERAEGASTSVTDTMRRVGWIVAGVLVTGVVAIVGVFVWTRRTPSSEPVREREAVR